MAHPKHTYFRALLYTLQGQAFVATSISFIQPERVDIQEKRLRWVGGRGGGRLWLEEASGRLIFARDALSITDVATRAN